MRHRRRAPLGLVLVGALALGTTAFAAGSSTRAGIVEVNVTHTPLRSSGEPEIAINPKNPNNLVYVSTYYRYWGVAGVRHPGGLVSVVSPVALLAGYEQCFVAWSDDRGKTWTQGAFPNGDRPYCGDPMVSVDRNGVFYIATDWMGNATTPVVPTGNNQGVNGDIGVISSVDGGRHWSQYGRTTDEPVATGTEVDRPFFRVDDVTGKLYEESGITGRKLAVSSDHGLTWTAPTTFPGNHLAVHGGMLATAEQAGQTGAFAGLVTVPGGTTQLTLQVSTDDGRTFASYPVHDSHGGAVTGGTGDWIAADPTKAGRFAIMQQAPSGDAFEVYVAQVSGRHVTFAGPARIAPPAQGRSGLAKPWMDFGSTGVLGVMWKSADTSAYDVYSAVSFDHGRTFSAPLRVNRRTHPAEDVNRGDAGDDLSWIALDGKYAYLGWGGVDAGLNALNGFFARVPLSRYSRH